MSRKTFQPGSDQRDSRLINYETTNSAVSVVKGIPASTLPDNALADGFNIITSPAVVAEGRTGSRLWSDTPIPSLDGRTGYAASLAGGIITANAAIFSEDDVGHFFVWPGIEEVHDEIIEYLSAFTVRVASAETIGLTTGCRLVGRTNLWAYHKVLKKFVFMFGTDIYCSDVDIAEFTRCPIVSVDIPQSAISGYSDVDDVSGVIFNPAGIFRIDFSTATPLVIRVNIPVPNRAVPGNIKNESLLYQYHYLFSCARIASDGNIRDRLTPCRIETEGGTNIWGDDYKDYSEVWTEEAVGNNDAFYGKMVCFPLAGSALLVSSWQNLGGTGVGSFGITINGVGPHQIVCDFSIVESLQDVARVIELSLQSFWLEATCDYLSGSFVITGGKVPGGSVSLCTMGFTGTDISWYMGGTTGTITSPVIGMPKIVGPIYVPNLEDGVRYQQHLTHFCLYRTRDLNNKYKIEAQEGQYNDPNFFIWEKDLRICGAFYATMNNGIITALVGVFEEADVGSTLEWEDGTRIEITEYVNSTTVRYTDSAPYYNDPSTTGACAIGNGRVMRASQSGFTVTRTHGSTFTSADVRKTIHWANGYRSYIQAYVDPNTVTVLDDFSKDVQGLTIDPVYRHFNDTTSDDVLDTRKTSLVLKQRFWQAMGNGNVGAKIPGLVFTAQRGAGELHYGQVPETSEYLLGYHDKGFQITKKINDDIQFMWLFKNALVIWTSRKTWRWPVDAYEFLLNVNTKDATLVINNIEIADEDRGMFDWGSFELIGDGRAMLLTNEPGGIGWRFYDGFQYGPNMLEIAEVGNERLPEIAEMQKATKALYDGHMGLMLWGRR